MAALRPLQRIAWMSGLHRAGMFSGVLLLAACETGVSIPELPTIFPNSVPHPACPSIQMLQDADKLAQYRPGPGRDITDIIFEAELVGFKGECEYQEDDGKFTSVELVLKVQMEVNRGPANPTREARLPYFVAIPKFYPSPEGRKDFSVRIVFPENVNTLTVNAPEIEINIPLSDRLKGPDARIFLGFALTREQLEENRKRRSARGARGG
ncbi:MAG: hypothetical protein O3A84_07170 [Proteobacteria bacterium]|nr:hypothetical protein [Pseudomonadota bacterium]